MTYYKKYPQFIPPSTPAWALPSEYAALLPENQVSSVIRAVDPPSQLAPYFPYSADWSGTNNYTYTQYYFLPGTFSAQADGQFIAMFYSLDGYEIAFVDSELVNGVYTLSEEISYLYYYVKIQNVSGSASANATYSAVRIPDNTTIPTDFDDGPNPSLFTFDGTADYSYSPYLVKDGAIFACSSTNFALRFYNINNEETFYRAAEFNGVYYAAYYPLIGPNPDGCFYVAFVNLGGSGTYAESSYFVGLNS
ncbi:MAG: hypothetical protein LBL96_07925 [Clostridiales bacterium]|nr:hypothetical protein [Clostridiales bacterium]